VFSLVGVTTIVCVVLLVVAARWGREFWEWRARRERDRRATGVVVQFDRARSREWKTPEEDPLGQAAASRGRSRRS
jgi:hypothetical protein